MGCLDRIGLPKSFMRSGDVPPLAIASSDEDASLSPHLFDQMANAVIHAELLYDDDGVPDDFIYIYVNPAFSRLTGLSSVEGRRLSETIPDVRTAGAPSLVLYDRVLRTGISESYENFVPSLDSWFSVQVFRVDDCHFLALFSEVTARKNTEKALERSQALLKEAQSIARIACWQLDMGSKEFAFTEGMRELFELSEDEIVDRHTCENRIHPDDRSHVDAAFETAVRTDLRLETRYRVLARDGSTRHFQVAGRIDRGDDGGLRLIGTTQDVTESVVQELALRESERRLTATIEASPVPLVLNDGRGRTLYLNAAFTRNFGYELSDIPTIHHWWTLAYPDPDYRQKVQQSWSAYLAEAQASGARIEPREIEIRAKDGSLRTVIAAATLVEAGPDGVHLTKLYDITDRKHLEERLRKQSAYLQNVIDGSPNALIMFDADGRLISLNRQFYDVHQIEPETRFTPEATTFDDIVHYFHARGDFPELSDEMIAAGYAGYRERRKRTNFEHKTIRGRVLEIDGIPLESGGTLLSYRDVTDRARLLDDARAAALHDPLTLLPNRRALEAHFNIMMAGRPASSALAALLMIDLDRFKALNDSFGHVYGDLLLAEVADRLKRCVRSSDLVARLGGDEFVVLLGGLADCHADARQAAERIAEDIRDALFAPYYLRPAGKEDGGARERIYACSASIGGWILPNDIRDLTSAIQVADKALYQSKSQGRNAVTIR